MKWQMVEMGSKSRENYGEEEMKKLKGRDTEGRRRICPHQEDPSKFPGQVYRVFMQPFPGFECLFPVFHKCVPAVEVIYVRHRGVKECSRLSQRGH